MKKHLLIFLVTSLYILPSIGQDTTYYDYSWKETTPNKGVYFRTKMKKDSIWEVTDHFRSGKPQMTGAYTDDSCHIKTGEFTWYDSENIISHRCSYIRGKADGSELFYYDNGQERVKGANKDGHHEGEWIGYYPSGKVSAKVSFQQDKQMSALFFNEDGSENKTVTEFMRDSDFSGGPAQFTRYLSKNLKYPKYAFKNSIEGTVILEFKVTTTGAVADVIVLQSVDKSLDDEAVRVIKNSSGWIPAIIGGIVSDSYKKQPIIFHL